MNFSEMVQKQIELDNRIIKEHGLENKSLLKKKIIALLVEIGECCNEIQDFKFWKKNLNTDSTKIKEELVDILHFILTIGLESKFDMRELNKIDRNIYVEDINDIFIELYTTTVIFHSYRTEFNYYNIMRAFLKLTKSLGLTEIDIVNEYNKKNRKNIGRQENNY